MSNLSQFFAKFIFLKNNFLTFLTPIFIHFWAILNYKNFNFKKKVLQFKPVFKSVFSIFCQIILVFGMTFGTLTTIPVHAQSGVIGFSDCKFGSAEEIRKRGEGGVTPGNESFKQCLRQILTFIFVLGVFLIGIRIAIEAFKSLNPVISGNSINNSVKLGQDIVIGLVLIGAPSIFLGLFNEAALQLPNLFELAQYRPGNEKAKTSSTTGSGTGTTGTGIGTGTTGGTTGSGTGTAGTGALSEDLVLPDGTKISKKDLEGALQQRTDGKPLTALQEKILAEYDKKNASQNVFIDITTGKVPRSIVEKALQFVKNNPTSGSTEFNTGLNYARGLLTNCLTNPTGDNFSCQLMKESGIQLGADQYRVLSPDGADFKLSPGWNKIGSGSPTVGTSGKDLKIQIKKGTDQQVELRQTCENASQTAKSPIANPNFKYTENQNLNSPGCSITAVYQKI